MSTPASDTPSLNRQLEDAGTKCTSACLPKTIAEPKCELGFEENLATCPMLRTFAGKTEATKALGENSTASAAE